MTGLVIVHTEPWAYAAEDLARLAAAGLVLEVPLAEADVAAVVARADPAALFLRIGAPADAALMDGAPSLRWIVTPTTGTEHIDVAAAKRRGIEVVSLRDAAFLRDLSATAEHTFALLLALARRIVPAAALVRDGAWRRDPLLGLDLRGRVLGVVGYGRLGRMVAGYGRAFGMPVLAHDTDHGAFADASDVTPARLNELLGSADIVSVHVSLNDRASRSLSAWPGLVPHRL